MKKYILTSCCFLFFISITIAKPTHWLNITKNDTSHVILLKQIDITKYINKPSDQFCLINDTLAIIYNTTRGIISTINLNNNKTIGAVSVNDSLLTEKLFSLGSISKKQTDSALALSLLPVNVNAIDGYNRPLGFSNYYYDGQNVWLGVHLSVKLPVEEHTSDVFLIKYNFSLTKIIKIYIAPTSTDVFDYVWPGMYYLQIDKDSNLIYLPDYTSSHNILCKYYLNDNTNRIELKKVYKTTYPEELTKGADGLNVNYLTRVNRGFNNKTIFMFCTGMYIYSYGNDRQTELSPGLADWGNFNGVNTITTFDYDQHKQQVFLILHDQSMIFQEPDSIRINYYYCYLNKNYQPIERKPIFFAQQIDSYNEVPDGTFQLVTENKGKFSLIIYKVF